MPCLRKYFDVTGKQGNNTMTPRIITFIILLFGLGLFSYSLTLPYTNQNAADILLNSSNAINEAEYYKREAELRTNKTTYMDLGAGITIASGTLLIFLLLTNTKTFSHLKNLKTLNKTTVFLGRNIIWLLLIPGTFWYYTFRGGRGDYQPFADSVGIPIVSFPFCYTN